jgi:hypothetical protein
MMHPETYLRARRWARFHVQVELEEVPENDPSFSDVPVNARVVRVFRHKWRWWHWPWRWRLKVGDRVSYLVSVVSEGDPIRPGGVFWTPYGALKNAKFMEVFLNGAPPRCSVAAWQGQIIDHATDEPVMNLTRLH